MKKVHIHQNLGYLLTTATNALVTHMQRTILEQQIDVPFEQLRVLMFISNNEGVKQQDICTGLNKVKPGVSRLVDGLVKKKLVEQRSDKTDRRVKNLHITSKGVEVRNHFYPIGLGELKKIETHLGEKETEQLKNHLRKIKEIISNTENNNE